MTSMREVTFAHDAFTSAFGWLFLAWLLFPSSDSTSSSQNVTKMAGVILNILSFAVMYAARLYPSLFVPDSSISNLYSREFEIEKNITQFLEWEEELPVFSKETREAVGVTRVFAPLLVWKYGMDNAFSSSAVFKITGAMCLLELLVAGLKYGRYAAEKREITKAATDFFNWIEKPFKRHSEVVTDEQGSYQAPSFPPTLIL